MSLHRSHFMFKDLSSYKSFSYKAKYWILLPVEIQCLPQGNQTCKEKHLARHSMIQYLRFLFVQVCAATS